MDNANTQVVNRGSTLRRLFHRSAKSVVRVRGLTNRGRVSMEVRTY